MLASSCVLPIRGDAAVPGQAGGERCARHWSSPGVRARRGARRRHAPAAGRRTPIARDGDCAPTEYPSLRLPTQAANVRGMVTSSSGLPDRRIARLDVAARPSHADTGALSLPPSLRRRRQSRISAPGSASRASETCVAASSAAVNSGDAPNRRRISSNYPVAMESRSARGWLPPVMRREKSAYWRRWQLSIRRAGFIGGET